MSFSSGSSGKNARGAPSNNRKGGKKVDNRQSISSGQQNLSKKQKI